MDKNIKLVIHCGKSTMELKGRELAEHGVLNTLKKHYANKPLCSWLHNTFEMLDQLAWNRHIDDIMRGDAFQEQLTIALGRETPLQRAMSRELHQQLSKVEAD